MDDNKKFSCLIVKFFGQFSIVELHQWMRLMRDNNYLNIDNLPLFIRELEVVLHKIRLWNVEHPSQLAPVLQIARNHARNLTLQFTEDELRQMEKWALDEHCEDCNNEKNSLFIHKDASWMTCEKMCCEVRNGIHFDGFCKKFSSCTESNCLYHGSKLWEACDNALCSGQETHERYCIYSSCVFSK